MEIIIFWYTKEYYETFWTDDHKINQMDGIKIKKIEISAVKRRVVKLIIGIKVFIQERESK